MPRRSWLAAIAILSALAVSMVAVAHAGAASCHHGTGPFTAPDNACTPGAGRIVGRTEAQRRAFVCSSKDRPSIPAAVRRQMLGEYGVPGWTGASGEIDHRWPLFLGGLTVEDNLWPEPGAIPNPKDRLEAVIRRRVCDGRPHGMRVRTAVRLFLADWRAGFTYYVLGVGPRPTP